uniref:Uncharacterized protein n=1 Tax=Globodera rostochiensis TaxID=31243 RepID=A0A914H3X5_GLORO
MLDILGNKDIFNFPRSRAHFQGLSLASKDLLNRDQINRQLVLGPTTSWGQLPLGANYVLGPTTSWGQLRLGANYVLGPTTSWDQLSWGQLPHGAPTTLGANYLLWPTSSWGQLPLGANYV